MSSQHTSSARPLLSASLKTLAAVATICVVGWLAWGRLEQWYRRGRADRLALAALRAPDGAAAPAVSRLPELGTVGVERLAWLAAEPRPDLAVPARRELDERLEAWLVTWRASDDAGDLLEPLTLAVRVLRARAAGFRAGDTRWCENFVLLALELSEAHPPEEAAALIGDCEAVLATLPRRNVKPHPADPTVVGRESTFLTPPIEYGLLTGSRGTPRITIGLAARPATESGPPPTSDVPDAATAVSPIPAAISQNAPEPVRADAEDQARAMSAPQREMPTAAGPGRSKAANGRLAPLPTPLEVRDQARQLREAPSQALMQQLHQADHFRAAAIRSELTARGVDMAAAAELSGADAADKTASSSLSERVAQLPAAEGRRVLRLLAEAGDAATRFEALSLMATMDDPQLPQIARRRAVHDDDPRVARRAAEIIESLKR